jgi:hypothetical protein
MNARTWLLVVVMMCAARAQAQSVSLHQTPLMYPRSSSIDADGLIRFVYTDPLVGFHDQSAPVGASGCVLGSPTRASSTLTLTQACTAMPA